jgi:hypothetical protein
MFLLYKNFQKYQLQAERPDFFVENFSEVSAPSRCVFVEKVSEICALSIRSQQGDQIFCGKIVRNISSEQSDQMIFLWKIVINVAQAIFYRF